MWAFVHVLYLIGWGNRMFTLGQWTWSLLTSNRAQLITVQSAHRETETDTPLQPRRKPN